MKQKISITYIFCVGSFLHLMLVFKSATKPLHPLRVPLHPLAAWLSFGAYHEPRVHLRCHPGSLRIRWDFAIPGSAICHIGIHVLTVYLPTFTMKINYKCRWIWSTSQFICRQGYGWQLTWTHETLGNELGASRVTLLKLPWFAGKSPADFQWEIYTVHEFTDGEFFILLSR